MPANAISVPLVCAAAGCKRSDGATPDETLKRCNHCKMVWYCCREHQVAHWKACHKEECFKSEDFSKKICFIYSGGERGNQQVSALELRQAKQKVDEFNSAGVFLYLGKTKTLEGNEEIMLLHSEADAHNEQDMDLVTSWPRELYLRKPPSALLIKAEDTLEANPTLALSSSALQIQEQCQRFSFENDQEAMPGVSIMEFNKVMKPQVIIEHAAKRYMELDKDDERRSQCANLIMNYWGMVDWTHEIAESSTIEERGKKVVHEVLELEHGTHACYITSPIPWFATLNKDQLGFFNILNENQSRLKYPVLRSPVIIYRNLKENWMVLRLNTRIHLPFPVNTQGRIFTENESDAVFLKMFMAAGEIGDAMAIYAAWDPAQRYAIENRKEHLFVHAAENLLDCLLKIHPEPSREEAFFRYKIGLVYESRASWLLKKQNQTRLSMAKEAMGYAVRAYHRAALATHEFCPSQGMRAAFYEALGVALTRLNEFDLAKRSFLWALSDPFGRKDISAMGDQLESLWILQHLPSHEREQATREQLKYQHREQKETLNKVWLQHMCTFCGQDCQGKFCTICRAAYCSRECQESDWKEHKKTHKKMAAQSEENVDFTSDHSWSMARCMDRTKRLLASLSVDELVHTMSMKEANQKVDAFERKRGEKTSYSFDIPAWLQEEMAD